MYWISLIFPTWYPSLRGQKPKTSSSRSFPQSYYVLIFSLLPQLLEQLYIFFHFISLPAFYWSYHLSNLSMLLILKLLLPYIHFVLISMVVGSWLMYLLYNAMLERLLGIPSHLLWYLLMILSSFTIVVPVISYIIRGLDSPNKTPCW
jgi:hypothetical protein